MAQANLGGGLDTTRDPYVFFGSKDRYAGSNTDFMVIFNNVQWGQDRMFEMRVKHISIPNEFYNVWPGANAINVLPFDQTVTITPGFYNESSLLAELQTQLNLIVGMTITIDPLTRRWIFTASSPFSFDLSPTGGSDSFIRTIGVDPYNQTADALVQTMPGPINLNRPGFVKVYNTLVEHPTIENSGDLTELMDLVSMAETEKHALKTLHYQDSDMAVFKWPEVRHLGQIRIFLTDEYNVPLFLPPNFDIFIGFKIGLQGV